MKDKKWLNVQLLSPTPENKTLKYPSEFSLLQEGCQPHMLSWHEVLHFMIWRRFAAHSIIIVHLLILRHTPRHMPVIFH